MENKEIYNLVLKKNNWIGHIIYWLISAILMFFIFSSREYDFNIRLILVSLIVLFSYIITYIINNYLTPRYLFTGRIWIFGYIVFLIFAAILWFLLYSSIVIVIYNAYNVTHLIVPKKNDIIMLVTGNYLIIVLAAVIHFVKESYRKLIERNDIAEQKQITDLKLKEANLKLLQVQIHPHCVFNMLNNLYGLVNENIDDSRNLIIKLSDLLDYMLYECDKPFVNINSEIKFIENYIELERIRHDENFNVKFKYKEIHNEVLIAPLILFPFVENAFKHGFKDFVENIIDIKIDLIENELEFEITNSLSEQKTDKYLKQEGKGIGLRNIQDRLNLIYKDNYELEINETNKEFTIKLNLKLNESTK